MQTSQVFSAAAALMRRSEDALFLLGYVSRAAAVDRSLAQQAQRAGLQLQEVPQSRRDVGGSLQGWVCAVTWRPEISSPEPPV